MLGVQKETGKPPASPRRQSLHALSPQASTLGLGESFCGQSVSASHSEAGDDNQSVSSLSQSKRILRKSTERGDASTSDNVKVICRVRPFNKREIDLHEEANAKIVNEWDKQQLRSVVEMDGRYTIFLDHEKDFSERQRFPFDVNLWSVHPDQQPSTNGVAGQEDVMRFIGEPACQGVWQGFNTCIFAYGQTGSGKTFTMMGSDDQRGLIPRLCNQLFEELQRRRAEECGVVVDNMTKEYLLEARFLEIYNERIRDLLWDLRTPTPNDDQLDKSNLKIRFVPGQGPYVVGLTCVPVDNAESCMRLIDEGTKHRSVAATKMNDQSSRSHSIFRLTLTQTTKMLPTKQFEKPKYLNRTSIVSLVDLAGSERNKKTGAEGARLKEAVAINQSLTSLKNVIDALVDGRQVIPYRDSNLTWLLSDNLGGNSRTFMIACVSPHIDNAEETLNTLRYAIRAQQIVNSAQINESEELRRMNRMREEMERIQRQMLENPHEDILEKQAENLRAHLAEMQAEQDRQLSEASLLQRLVGGAEALQHAAVYKSAFAAVWSRRVEQMFSREMSALTHSKTLLTVDVDSLSRDVHECDLDLQTLRIEDKVAREYHHKVAGELDLLRFRGEGLERSRNTLLAEEMEQGAILEGKTPLLTEARRIAMWMIAWQKYLCNKEQVRVIAARSDDMDRNVTLQEKFDADAKVHRDQLLQEALKRRQEAEKRVVEVKALLERRTKELAVTAASRNEECIFYENENRRIQATLDMQQLKMNQQMQARQSAQEDSWKGKISALQTESKLKIEKRVNELRERVLHIQTEAHAERQACEDAAKAEIAKQQQAAHDEYDAKAAAWQQRLNAMDTLNHDSRVFLVEHSDGEPRFRKLSDTLAAVRPTPGDVAATELVEQLRVLILRAMPTSTVPLSFRCEDFEAATVTSSIAAARAVPAPTVAGASAAAPGTHSEAPIEPRQQERVPNIPPLQVRRVSPGPGIRKPVAAAPSSPVTPRSVSVISNAGSPITPRSSAAAAGSPFDRLHAGGSTVRAVPAGSIAALKPCRMSVHPTKTSVMRSSVHNYRKVGDTTPVKSPNVTTATPQHSARGVSPARSLRGDSGVSPLDAGARKTIYVDGGCFFVGRSKTPIRSVSPRRGE